MIVSILADNPSIAYGISHVLSRINYRTLHRRVRQSVVDEHSEHSVVLFEYVHSGIYDRVAHIERIPGTVKPIDDFLKMPEVMNALKSLFACRDGMSLYTRRKVIRKPDGSVQLTRFRQLVLKITPEMPSLIPPVGEPWSTSYSDVDD